MSSADYVKRFIHPEAKDIVGVETRKAIETDDPNFSRQLEHRIIYADGDVGYITVRFFIVKDEKGRTIKTYGVNQDVTERKRAGEALRKELEFNQNILNTAQAIVLLLDINGYIVKFNLYMEEISGYRLDEVRGKDWFSTFLPKENLDRTRTLFKKAISDIKTQGNIDSIITKDGRELYIEWYDTTMKGENGKIIGLLSIGQDVTERKRAEMEIQKRAKELEDFYVVAIDRELRIKELKEKIEELKTKLKKYENL